LNGALQGTGSEVGVVTLREQQFFGGVGELDRDLAIGEQAAHILKAQLYDLHQLFFAERTEDNDVIDAIQKFRPEVAVQRVHHLFAGLFEIFRRAEVLGL